MPYARSDQVKLIGFALLLVAIAAANTVLDLSAAAEGPWQMIGMVAIASVGLAGLWLIPNLILAAAFLVVTLIISIVLGYFRTDPLFLPMILPVFGFAGAVWLAGALVMRLIPSRLAVERRHLAIVVGAMLAVGHIAVAIAMFQVVNPIFRLSRDAATQSGEAIAAAARDPAHARRYGLLVEATLTPRPGEDAEVARVRCQSLARGQRRSAGFQFRDDRVQGADRFTATLADGSVVRVQQVDFRHQTQDWPERGGGLSCRIDAGDVVTIWGTPVAAGETGLMLSDTRFIGYGDAQTVLATLGPVAERDARRFGGLAFFVAFTGLLPLIAGFLAWWRRGRTG